jgi:preprotein translocase subunit SecD
MAQSASETVVRFTGFLGNLQLTAADVRADLVGDDPDTRQIAIAMNETASAAFAQFTTTHVNQTVSFFVCDQPMQAITVQAPIGNGFALSDPIALDSAIEIVAALNGQGVCP